MNPQTILQYRRWFEVGFWVLIVVVYSTANSITVNMDLARLQTGHPTWMPWVWEFSSGLTWLLIIPLLVRFDHRFPLVSGRMGHHLLAHLAFTVPFSFLHVIGMVTLREAAYAFSRYDYSFGNWPVNFGYEYLKDFRTYAAFLATIYLYRFVVRRWQGEAEFLVEGKEEQPAEPVVDRFLVKKLGREFLVKVDDIDWIESSGNYVTLHVGDRLYPLRETMSGIERKLAGQGFARVHRTAILNLDRVKVIEPFDTGDARAHLVSGHTVPVSRRYRQVLKDRLR